MLGRIRKFLAGHRTVDIPRDEACAAFDMIYRNGLSFTGERRRADGSIRVTMTERDSASFSRLAAARDMHPVLSSPHGLPVVLDYMKHRPVIPIGLILTLVWMLYSERLVWDIRVSGNTKTPTDEIIAQLDSLGFGVGTYYPSVNFNKLHAEYSAAQDDLAWLSIYMDGAVADIEVREEWHDEREKHADGVYANVVAEVAGVVRSVNVFEGVAAVKAGDTVVPGQVLISGVIPMKEENQVRYEYAAGEVNCTVCEPIDVSSAVTRTEKRFTGHEKSEISVKIFKKTVNLFVNGGNDVPSCDKIETVKQVSLANGRIRLPIFIEKTVWREYAEEEVTVPPENVANEVLSLVSARLKSLAERGTMISKELSAKYENGVYRISGAVYLERDIGEPQEFTVK